MRTIVTKENIEQVKYGMPLDQEEELRPGCITWVVVDDRGILGRMTVWPDTGRGAIWWGGNSVWGDWDEDKRVLVLDEDAPDGGRIFIHEDGTEEVTDQPWWGEN